MCAVKAFQRNLGRYLSFEKARLLAGKPVLQIDPNDMFTYMGYLCRSLRMSYNTTIDVSSSCHGCLFVPEAKLKRLRNSINVATAH